jgi:hypothetical protein
MQESVEGTQRMVHFKFGKVNVHLINIRTTIIYPVLKRHNDMHCTSIKRINFISAE